MNGERYEAAKAFASGRVVHELMHNEPLSDISCYASSSGDADRTRYDGNLPYACTLSGLGGYYFGVGFKRVDGRWIGFEEHDLGLEGTQHAKPRQRVRSAAVNLVHALNQGSYRLAAAYASPKVVKQLRRQRHRVSECYATDGNYSESRYNGQQPYGCNLYIPPCCQTGVGFKHLDRGWTAVKVVPVAD